MKYLKIVSKTGVTISILASRLTTLDLNITPDSKKITRFPKLDLPPELHPDLTQLALNNVNRTNLDISIGRECVPIGITELYMSRLIGDVTELSSIPMFDLERRDPGKIIIKATTLENAEIIRRFRLPITVMSILNPAT